jgi:hypothetical protein
VSCRYLISRDKEYADPTEYRIYLELTFRDGERFIPLAPIFRSDREAFDWLNEHHPLLVQDTDLEVLIRDDRGEYSVGSIGGPFVPPKDTL